MPELRHDADQLLPQPPDAAAEREAGHAAVARKDFRMDAAQQRDGDGILPPADQPRGRTGQSGPDLAASCRSAVPARPRHPSPPDRARAA